MSVPKKGTNGPKKGTPEPCPFCGHFNDDGFLGFVTKMGEAYAYCDQCGAEGPKVDFSDDGSDDFYDRAEIAATDAWNRRAP